jgi:hypothetical protein
VVDDGSPTLRYAPEMERHIWGGRKPERKEIGIDRRLCRPRRSLSQSLIEQLVSIYLLFAAKVPCATILAFVRP